MRSGFQLAVNVANVFFQCLAQIRRHLGRGFAVAFGHFVLQTRNGFLHERSSLFTQVFQHRGIHLWLGNATCALTACSRSAFTAQFTQLVRPHRHGRQRGRLVVSRFDSHGNSSLERIPHRQQLAA